MAVWQQGIWQPDQRPCRDPTSTPAPDQRAPHPIHCIHTNTCTQSLYHLYDNVCIYLYVLGYCSSIEVCEGKRRNGERGKRKKEIKGRRRKKKREEKKIQVEFKNPGSSAWWKSLSHHRLRLVVARIANFDFHDLSGVSLTCSQLYCVFAPRMQGTHCN